MLLGIRFQSGSSFLIISYKDSSLLLQNGSLKNSKHITIYIISFDGFTCPVIKANEMQPIAQLSHLSL